MSPHDQTIRAVKDSRNLPGVLRSLEARAGAAVLVLRCVWRPDDSCRHHETIADPCRCWQVGAAIIDPRALAGILCATRPSFAADWGRLHQPLGVGEFLARGLATGFALLRRRHVGCRFGTGRLATRFPGVLRRRFARRTVIVAFLALLAAGRLGLTGKRAMRQRGITSQRQQCGKQVFLHRGNPI